ncbi:MAG: type 1 glutamine amidotransferase-like domain-containing protein [Gammaproteobacteria bacterium]|nr:type 1 glutamine amidotransferase-like domain-containing protein [Gammaproteobacteria bacterium]
MMILHLFSNPGVQGIEYIKNAIIPHFSGVSNPVLAYLPAGNADMYKWLNYTVQVFQGEAKVDLLDPDNMSPNLFLEILEHSSGLYITGGNVYLLSYRLHRAKVFNQLRSIIRGGLPVVAFSAGTVLCGVDISTTLDEDFCEMKDYTGLALVPYGLSVHATENNIRLLQKKSALIQSPILAIEDNSYLQVTDTAIQVLSGTCWRISPNSQEAAWHLPLFRAGNKG